MRHTRASKGRAAAASAVLTLSAALLAPAVAAAADGSATARFTASRDGEALMTVTARAPGADWGVAGRESAVLRIEVDGAYNQDVVLFGGERSLGYRVMLGPVRRGRHTVTAAVVDERTPDGVRARISSMTPRLASDRGRLALARRYSPVVYGRDLPEIPGATENDHTDVPLLTYHTQERDADGNTVLEYTVIWSNEDGGTNTPALMARWGRTTDIEWVYRVVLSPAGDVLSETYQAPDHATLEFDGARLGDHPMLITSTSNNNMLPVYDPAPAYRFIPDASRVLPPGRAREAVMDANPWTYEVMAKEMIREGKVEATPSPDTPEMSDQRDYLWLEIDKDTAYPAPPADGGWVGTAIQVKLAGDDRWYTSNHGVPDWSIQRDIPASTTVELPPGKGPDDVEAIRAVAAPVPGSSGAAPADYAITVTAINRGFFLGDGFRPQSSFVRWHGSEVLTPARPEAVLWSR